MLNKLLIIGGDKRQHYMADFLEEKGFDILLYGLLDKKCNVDNLKNAITVSDVVIFPLPVSKDGKNINSSVKIKENIDEILSFIENDKIIFGGMIDKGIENKIKKKNIKCFDYFAKEDLTIKNTVPTVQGILKVVIDNIDYTIHSANIAVFGFGRVGKLTADVFSSIGAKVTVCARKSSDVINAELKNFNGCKIKEFYKISEKFNIIINTVPDLVIDRNILENLNNDCLIIDVSSAPYGVDFASAYDFGIKVLQCPSLPGKVAPKTAGKIIGETIIDILKEENLWIN